MKRSLPCIAVLGILAALVPLNLLPHAADPTVAATLHEECSYDVLSGTIRWVNSTSWVVLDDAEHTPTGIASVVLLTDRVRVIYDFDVEVVSSLQATPDEAFASANVRVGASVGTDYTDIFFYMPESGSTPVSPALLSKAGANVWLTGWFDLECAP